MNLFSTLFLCLLFLASACKSSEKKAPLKQGWLRLEEPDYSISYPDSFELDKSGRLRTKFILSVKSEDYYRVFRENVNLMRQNIKSMNLDLAGFAKLSEKEILELIPEAKLISSESLKKNKQAYHKIIYTGEQQGMKLQWLQYYFVEGDRAYVLTFTARQAVFSDYQALAEEICESFELLHAD